MQIVADDWGFSRGINDGILELARKKIISGVSLLANADLLHYRIDELRSIPGLELAWHLNFTAGAPVGRGAGLTDSKGRFFGLREFVWRWSTGRIKAASLAEEAAAQAAVLDRAAGRLVEMDGHHHVHLIPGVLAAVEGVRARMEIPSVRLPIDVRHWPSLLGSAWALCRRRKRVGPRFRVYGYPQQKHFRSLAAFARSSQGGRRPVLVHPAAYDDFAGNPYGDPLQAERVSQYQALLRWFS
jgi:predicted glycoside hydrolase/deacetylase ChbG (UPF0249 family)